MTTFYVHSHWSIKSQNIALNLINPTPACTHCAINSRHRSVAVVKFLNIILRDEIGHAAIGNRWYRWLCERAGLDPVAHYPVLVERHQAGQLHPPLNRQVRLAAGVTQAEVDALLKM